MNIVDVFQEYKIPYLTEGHHHCRLGWIQISCPFCGTGNWRMGYKLAGRYFSCWSCGVHSAWSVLSHWVPRHLLSELIDSLPRERIDLREFTGRLKVPEPIGPLVHAHKQYLKGRNLKPKRMESIWSLGGIGNACSVPYLSWALYVPIYFQGSVVSWTSRTLLDKGQRWRTADKADEAIDHKQILYGIDHCRNSVCVVEGCSDVWNIGPGAVGTFGLIFSPSQIELLRQFPVRGICMDNSEDAQAAAKKLAETLSPFPGKTYLIKLKTGSDPGSADKKEIKQLRKFLEL